MKAKKLIYSFAIFTHSQKSATIKNEEEEEEDITITYKSSFERERENKNEKLKRETFMENLEKKQQNK